MPWPITSGTVHRSVRGHSSARGPWCRPGRRATAASSSVDRGRDAYREVNEGSAILFKNQANPTVEAFAVHLIREGLWREAVALCREEAGLSVAQAEHLVERIALKHGVHRYSRAFFVSWIAACGFSVLALAGWLEWWS